MGQESTENPTTEHDENPPAEPEETPDPAEAEDDSDPRVKRANSQAAKYRTQLRETEGKVDDLQKRLDESDGVLQALRKALTGEDAEEKDPAKLLEKVTGEADTLRSDNDTLRTEVTQLRRELLVHDLAAENGGDPRKLLDSRSFTRELEALDADSDDHRDKVAEAIRSAVENNSSLRAGQGSSRGGAEGAGRTSGGGITQEQFDAMGYAERADLFQKDPTQYRALAG